ncbi:MAG TPA: hypothetical protein PK175_10615 [Syntrophales bacterium]|jgi:hypothetical protein|nr:hypothetical protein [Syntrophales bacterium]HQG35315.1 hypothetical protein [Syntrophales bacterium]HQI36493.1 hypothetical protein [Syntrophales bacterium]HRU87871.1 hypothetical protein [Syntrophales bacterium]
MDKLSRKPLIGVMGPGGEVTPELLAMAEELGRLIARAGGITLTGGRNAGVMAAASRGAKSAGGLTVGILPTETRDGISPDVDIPIITGMGNARNNINVLSSEVVIACGMGPGTAAEIALALKAGKRVVLLACPPTAQTFFQELGGPLVFVAHTPAAALGAAITSGERGGS